eukprot:663695-Rhodomonas_salina.1
MQREQQRTAHRSTTRPSKHPKQATQAKNRKKGTQAETPTNLLRADLEPEQRIHRTPGIRVDKPLARDHTHAQLCDRVLFQLRPRVRREVHRCLSTPRSRTSAFSSGKTGAWVCILRTRPVETVEVTDSASALRTVRSMAASTPARTAPLPSAPHRAAPRRTGQDRTGQDRTGGQKQTLA